MEINKKWQRIKIKKIAPKGVMSLLKKQKPYILDVRPLNFKRDTTFIENSQHCPLVYLAERYPEIPEDHPLIITDWAMKQSPIAAKFLSSNGYQVLGILKGGLERWKSENFPVVSRKVTGKVGLMNKITETNTNTSSIR